VDTGSLLAKDSDPSRGKQAPAAASGSNGETGRPSEAAHRAASEALTGKV